LIFFSTIHNSRALNGPVVTLFTCWIVCTQLHAVQPVSMPLRLLASLRDSGAVCRIQRPLWAQDATGAGTPGLKGNRTIDAHQPIAFLSDGEGDSNL